MEIMLSLLLDALREVDGALVKTGRCAGFHAANGEAELCQLFSNASCGRLRNASAGRLHLAHVHQAVKESPCSENHSLGTESEPKGGLDALHYPTLDDEFIDRILPHVQIWRVFQHLSPLENELLAVALRTRTPHRGSLAAVEHSELDAGTVGNNTHLAAQGVNLAHDLPLGDAAYCGITAHLRDFVHVNRDQQGV